MKDIKNITVNYDNNESKTITKDLHLIVTAVVALSQELGMLDEEEREVD